MVEASPPQGLFDRLRRGKLWIGATLIITVTAVAVAVVLLRSDEEGPGPVSAAQIEDGELCTLIGCSPGVAVTIEGLQADLPQARRLLLCIDGAECRLSSVPGSGRYSNVIFTAPFKHLRPVLVEFSILGPGARTLRNVRTTERLRPFYPNGKRCGGGCARLDLFYDLETNRLIVDRGRAGDLRQ